MCAEPSIEEAQPAWWLELQRSEALQEEVEKCHSLHEESSPPRMYTFRKEADQRTVQFASETFAHAGVRCYENDSEFIISQTLCKPRPRQGLRLPETEQMAPWDLSDLDDIESLRRMLLPEVEAPPPSLYGSLSTSSLVDFQCGTPPSDTEPVFAATPQSYVDTEPSRDLSE